MKGTTAWRTDPPPVPDGIDLDNLAHCRSLDVRWTKAGYTTVAIATSLGRAPSAVDAWRMEPDHRARIDQAQSDARTMRPEVVALCNRLYAGESISSASRALGYSISWARSLRKHSAEVGAAMEESKRLRALQAEANRKRWAAETRARRAAEREAKRLEQAGRAA